MPAEPQSDVRSVTHAELPDNMTLVDVRSQEEWDLGHAPGAVHMPLEELPGRLDELPSVTPIVVTCRTGGRASRAVAFLRDRGYDAACLAGGMVDWHAANRPMTRSGPGTPEVA